MVTTADSVTPDASFTSILFTIDEHRCGVTERYTCDDSREISGEIEVFEIREVEFRNRGDIKPSRRLAASFERSGQIE